MLSPQTGNSPLKALQRMARRSAEVERCELCGAELGPVHPHLLDLNNRQLTCACQACATLFPGAQNGRYRRVPRDSRRLEDFSISDELWRDLGIPINLAFLYRDSAKGKVVATYPSPAGAMEALVSASSWEELEALNPRLVKMEPDVEALLVNRVGDSREHYLVPIDQCYKLVGIVRTHWRGLSGGTEVWKQVRQFFADLQASAVASKGAADA